jgi:hypothetical protein
MITDALCSSNRLPDQCKQNLPDIDQRIGEAHRCRNRFIVSQVSVRFVLFCEVKRYDVKEKNDIFSIRASIFCTDVGLRIRQTQLPPAGRKF